MIDRAIQVVLGIALALSLFWGTVQGFKLRDIRAEFQQYKAEQAVKQSEAVAKAIQDGNKRIEAVQEAVRNGEKSLSVARSDAERLRVDAVSATGKSRRLFDELADCRSGSQTPTTAAQASSAPSSVRTDVLRRLEEAERAIVRFADETAVDDQVCRDAYAAVR